MLDKKVVANFRRRINKAGKSFSVGTDLCLSFDLDRLTHEERVFLRDALLDSRKPLRYTRLDALIEKGA